MKKILLSLVILAFSSASSLAHINGKDIECGELAHTMQSFREAWSDVYYVEILDGKERDGFLEFYNSISPPTNYMASSVVVLGRPNMSAYCVVLFQGNMCVTWGCLSRAFVEPFLKGDKR